MNNKDNELLVLDQEFSPIIMVDECENLKPIIKDFIQCYVENKDKPIGEWLIKKISEYLPDNTQEEIQSITNEIMTTIEINESNKKSLTKAIENGRSKENWFAAETLTATSAMSTYASSSYLARLDLGLKLANESLYRTITTQSGTINMNPRLDGFIAEQYHAQTFNLNAEATGSQYRAKVLESNGTGYAKNSVDIVIIDSNGKIVKRYQSKYCKDAKSTIKGFENGDYRGQQKLVADGQHIDIQKKSTIVLEAPDGTKSNPLTKSSAEIMRDEAQSGHWKDLNWNQYKTKDLAIGVGKQAGYAALQGAAIGVGFDVAQKIWNGEEIKSDEIINTAISSGADFGIKAATAGAVKVGVEKGVIKFIPKGTPASTIANIAFVGIENAKVIGKMMSGELSVKEGIEKIEQTSISTVAGLVTMGKGTAVGATVGAIFGPAGVAIGGFVGGTVGYMAGAKVGETFVKGAQKIRDGAINVVNTVTSNINNIVDNAKNEVSMFCGNICSGVASLFGF